MINILLINIYLHFKNEHAIRNYKNITFTDTHDINTVPDLSKYDCVFSPTLLIDVSKYPNTFFIFGPHTSVFPENNLSLIIGKNAVYNNLSDWVHESWRLYAKKYNIDPVNHINFIKMPFGVDIGRYNETKHINYKTEVMVYSKTRDPAEILFVTQMLQKMNIKYRLFSYDQRYNEIDYVNFLRECKYGIWIGRHESQGFALEECLASNVPLLVWDVKSMSQEYGLSYDPFPATAIPYWDERCGEFFFQIEEFLPTFMKFIEKLHNYRPREYITENLSFEKCEQKMIDIITQYMPASRA